MSKSVLAQYIDQYKIESWQDFPENDKIVCEYFHEREDHGHVLKRFTLSFRDGNIPGIYLRRLVQEA